MYYFKVMDSFKSKLLELLDNAKIGLAAVVQSTFDVSIGAIITPLAFPTALRYHLQHSFPYNTNKSSFRTLGGTVSTLFLIITGFRFINNELLYLLIATNSMSAGYELKACLSNRELMSNLYPKNDIDPDQVLRRARKLYSKKKWTSD